MNRLTTAFLMATIFSLIASCTKTADAAFDEMTYSPSSTQFCLWSPEADAVQVNLYQTDSDEVPYSVINLKKSKKGYWRGRAKEDLMNRFYTFQVTWKGEKLHETPGINATAVGLNGKKGAIIDRTLTNPDGWAEDRRPELASADEVILYEMHHRDFSMDSASGIDNKGRFISYTENGTTNSFGDKTGIDHLTELGITHVHILPSFDGAGDEIANEYNWGYDPLNYNVPEGKYSTDPADPYARIREFKQMVQAFHKNGIRVVLDVVYNHTATQGDSNFDLTYPQYFYRMRKDGTYSDGSGCGNETASEHGMMRRYIVESVRWWAKEYHIDGFRFDLMGIHDIQTMNEVRAALDAIDPSIIVYGEGWSAGTCEYDSDLLAMKANMSLMPGIAAFGDELRDAVRGPFSDDSKGAFLCGITGNEESIKFGLVGAIPHVQIDYGQVNYSSKPWATEPTQMISYVSCHDDLCLSDRIRNNIKGDDATHTAALKLAQTIALCSQGIPFIFNGEEIFRDKMMVHNSYKSPDSVNAIEWDRKHVYRDVFDYMKEMIAIRKEHKAFHMGNADLVRKNVDFPRPDHDNLVIMHINGAGAGDSWKDIYVAFNGNTENVSINIPDGRYKVVCEDGKASRKGIRTISGPYADIAATSAIILVKE